MRRNFTKTPQVNGTEMLISDVDLLMQMS